ncbi:uncharacterized protein LOC126742259 [Anthonomus grandis grandis]|uniref:uncharacterized protein LOC126742259 n=1 Tax=Anthonomus grandis grandis TaxID=2921223 RepID=UPI002165AD33|nr:uncharacterized protein LOC126742259 [Anthonomus grandis grandis]
MIEPTLVSLQHDLDFGAVFRELNEYIRRQWIERVTAQHFSVFRQRHRTNNVMESYHRRLNSKLSRHPGVWDLIETLIDIQNTASIELTQLEQHPNVYRIARKNVVFDARLNQAWDKLSDGRFTVGDFLRQAVHFVDGIDGQLHQWNQEVPTEEEEEAVVVPLDHLHRLLMPAPIAQPPRNVPILLH